MLSTSIQQLIVLLSTAIAVADARGGMVKRNRHSDYIHKRQTDTCSQDFLASTQAALVSKGMDPSTAVYQQTVGYFYVRCTPLSSMALWKDCTASGLANVQKQLVAKGFDEDSWMYDSAVQYFYAQCPNLGSAPAPPIKVVQPVVISSSAPVVKSTPQVLAKPTPNFQPKQAAPVVNTKNVKVVTQQKTVNSKRNTETDVEDCVNLVLANINSGTSQPDEFEEQLDGCVQSKKDRDEDDSAVERRSQKSSQQDRLCTPEFYEDALSEIAARNAEETEEGAYWKIDGSYFDLCPDMARLRKRDVHRLMQRVPTVSRRQILASNTFSQADILNDLLQGIRTSGESVDQESVEV